MHVHVVFDVDIILCEHEATVHYGIGSGHVHVHVPCARARLKHVRAKTFTCYSLCGDYTFYIPT